MKLLVSVTQPNEVIDAIEGGASILDVKNPLEGTFGASSPFTIRKIAQLVNGRVPLSVTLGDLPDIPGTAALAALGATVAGANYIKVGLYGVSTKARAVKMLSGIHKTLSTENSDAKIIAAGYADFFEIGSIAPSQLVEAACDAKVHGVLIDIASKSRHSLFDCLDLVKLESIAEQAHKGGLEVAFAGGLTLHDIPRIYATHADIFGVRRAVCQLIHGHPKLSGTLVSEISKVVRLQPKIYEL